MSRPCRMCGRPLTAPTADGYGPVCARKLHNRPAARPAHTQPALEEITVTELDLWQQPNGFPRADYFETVHDALTTIGITPESWHQGDPWEGAVVLAADALAGTRYAGLDELVVAWRVDQDCEPKHADDFEGEGWYLVTIRGEQRNVVDLPDLPYLAEPVDVARAVAEQLGDCPGGEDCRHDGDGVPDGWTTTGPDSGEPAY